MGGDDDDDDYNPQNLCDIGPNLITRNVAIYIACGAITTIALLIFYGNKLCAKRRPTRRPGASAAYGVHPMTEFMGWLGWCFSVPNLVFFFYYHHFYPTADLACQSQYEGMGIPIFGILFTLLCLNFVSITFLQGMGRPGLLSSLRVNGDETVLVLPAGRGFYAAGVAKVVPRGTVICCDAWGTRWNPDPMSWCQENMAREGAAMDHVTFLSTKFPRIPVPDNSVDVVCAPFFGSTAWFSDRDEGSDLKLAKKQALLIELFRVVKPGGVIWGVEITLKVSDAHKDFVRAGFVQPRLEVDQHFLSVIPSKVWTIRKAVGPVPDYVSNQHAFLANRALTLLPTTGEDGTNPNEPVTHSACESYFLLRMLGLAGLFAAFILLCIWQTRSWSSLEVPSYMPWGNQIAAQIIQSSRIWPLSLYFGHKDWLKYVRGPSTSVGGMLARMGKYYVFTVVSLLAYEGITWFPCFLLDLILHAAGTSLKSLFYINSWFNIIFIIVLIQLSRMRGQWAQARADAKGWGTAAGPGMARPPPGPAFDRQPLMGGGAYGMGAGAGAGGPPPPAAVHVDPYAALRPAPGVAVTTTVTRV